MEKEFLGKLGSSNLFSAQKQVVSKKKVFTEIESDFSAKIGNSNAFSHRITTSTSAPNFLWGGCFQFFTKNWPKKQQNTSDFAYFTSQWGGLKPPPRLPPGYATVHRWASQCKTLASLTTSPLTNFTPPLTLIRYFQPYLTEVNKVR